MSDIVTLCLFQLEDIITRIALKGWEERRAVLEWALRTYPGPQMMADPTLRAKRCDMPKIKDLNQAQIYPLLFSQLPPLLDRPTVTKLQTQYLRALSDDYQGKVSKYVASAFGQM